MHSLSAGAIANIMDGSTVDNPVLQVLGKKEIPKNSNQQSDRYRLLLSDSQHSISTAMLATQLNHLVQEGQLEKFTVIKLNKYICNVIPPDKRVMILLDIEIVSPGNEINKQIGNPVMFGKANSGASSAASTAPVAKSTTANSSSAAGASGGAQKSFYGNSAPQSSAMSRVQSGATPYGNGQLPQTPGGSVPKVYPIVSLTPYQNRWTIRARVTQKSAIRTWSNSRGEGKLFSMNLLDESGEIRATAFTQEVDKFYEMIEVNKIYYITKGTLKPANKQYSNVNNDYEMTFSRETMVTPCDEEVDLPSLKFDFAPITSLGEKEPNSLIDLIAVVKSVAEVSSIMTKKDNREVKKRDIELVDESGQMIRMTLWGNEAESFDGSSHPVMAIKGARLSDFGGRSLSTVGSTQMIKNPDIPESHQLRGWYDSVGHKQDFTGFQSDGQGAGGSLSNWKMFAEVLDDKLGQRLDNKADFFTAKGTIAFMKKDNCMYMACPSADCNKKLVDNGNSTYRCEKCAKEFDSYKWRMILQINLADCSATQWVTCFQESAETILGITASELGEMRLSDEASFDRVFLNATFKQFVFRLRAKSETYNDEERLKVICVGASPVNFVEYNARLLQDIESLSGASS